MPAPIKTTMTSRTRRMNPRYGAGLRPAVAAALASIAACVGLASCASEPDAAPGCAAEPQLRSTPEGVEFVRTPDACFDALPDWNYAPRYVEIDGLRQAFIDEGPEDGEVVLMLHGQPSWSYLYRRMVPVLVDSGYRVIAMDHLGMGRSDKPTAVEYYSYLLHGERLEQFIVDLDLRDITLFVQDWGSLIGLRVVGLNIDRFARIAIGNGDLPVVPEGVQTVVVEDPEQIEDLPFPFAGVFDQQVPFYDGCNLIVDEVVAQLGDDPQLFQAWANYAMKGQSFRPSEVLEKLTWFDLPDAEEAAYDAPYPSRIYLTGPRTFPSLAAGLGGLNEDAWAALSAFPRPLITIWGANDAGSLGQCATQDKYICTVPGAAGQAHARLDGAGHFLQDDQGAEIARRLVSFMRQDGAVVGNYSPDCGDDSGTEDGLGASCETDDDCADQPADHCLSMPGQTGFCTIEGCRSGECAASFSCCRDCDPAVQAALPFDGSACVPDMASSQLQGVAGCTCD